MTSEQLYYMSLLYADGSWAGFSLVHSKACNHLGAKVAKLTRSELLAAEYIKTQGEQIRARAAGVRAVEKRLL